MLLGKQAGVEFVHVPYRGGAPAMNDAGADSPIDLSVLQWPDTVRVAHTRQRHQRTHDLRDQGLSMRAIARRLDQLGALTKGQRLRK